MEEKKVARQYFLPGEVLLQLRHPPDVEDSAIFAAVQVFLQSNIDDKKKDGKKQEDIPQDSSEPNWNRRLTLPESNAKVITIPLKNKNGQIFSLVPVRLSEHDENDLSQEDVSRILVESYRDIGKDPISTGINDIDIESVSPNWLSGGLHHGPSTGGPGGWPFKADPPVGDGWKFKVKTSIKKLEEYKEKLTGTEFHVAILDTAPSKMDMDRAYHDYPDHPLVKALFGPNSKLDIKHADEATISQFMHFSPDSHHYWMADHGTFIAGIIHTLAPDAKLHLYEVLGPYGVGSFESVAQGLVDAIVERGESGYPLIINCSLMFSTPVKGVKDLDSPMVLKTGPIDWMTKSMKGLFDWITVEVPNVVLVAAAGNDAYNNSDSGERPLARLPASFEHVVGVGGLPKDFRKEDDGSEKYKAATYSNLSDTPTSTGFMTLGGESGSDQGVLGVFISNFPVHNPEVSAPNGVSYTGNATGWARWAGTSFAAPIISGLLANFSPPPNAPEVPPTKKDERVIEVRQKIDEVP